MDVRVVISVNGLRYSYPSSSVWQAIKPDMETNKERCFLPSADSYRVSFLVFSDGLEAKYDPDRDPGGQFNRGSLSRDYIGQATSTAVDEISAARLPSGVRFYDVFGLARNFTRSASRDDASVRIFYSID
jgi:hypothetical protein